MNKNKNAQMGAFRLLDAAPSGSLNESERIKANAGLQQILESDPDDGRVTDHRSHALRSHPVRRIATPVAVALAAAVTATVVLFPGRGPMMRPTRRGLPTPEPSAPPTVPWPIPHAGVAWIWHLPS